MSGRTLIMGALTIPAITMITEASPQVLAALFAWFSPAFPTGGFAYSHGLEQALADDLIADEAGLADWIESVLAWGAGWNDAVLLKAAHTAAVEDGSSAALRDLAELAGALAPCRERHAESLGQGWAFLEAVGNGWPGAKVVGLSRRVAFPVAVGAATAQLGAPLRVVLIGYLNGLASNLVAAGVRLGICGQAGGVRVLAGLGPVILDIAARAGLSNLDDLGGCALNSDIAAMRHETLETRLFIS